MATRKDIRRTKIKFRIRHKVSGTAEKPRLSVFRSNKEIYAQLIDDVKGVTLAAASSLERVSKRVAQRVKWPPRSARCWLSAPSPQVSILWCLTVTVTSTTVVLNRWQMVPEKVD